jgi:hypothetical protein
MYRSYVPLQNIDSFYQAFDIQSNDGMYIAPDKELKSGRQYYLYKKIKLALGIFLFIAFAKA